MIQQMLYIPGFVAAFPGLLIASETRYTQLLCIALHLLNSD